jgi:isopentenyl diphosphate isomerase/L-lactate dehydrogenase-like FMN-dependent dehydrogenase
MSELVNWRELDVRAEAALAPLAWAYCSGGAADEVTLRDNEAAWSRHRLRPRLLVPASPVDTSTTLLGTPVSLPVGVAPTALHGLCCPDAELATARAAAAEGLLFTLSNLSTLPIEDLAAAEGPRWFQLYAHRERPIATDVVARAVDAGFSALVVTADLPVLGNRERERRGGYEWGTAHTYGTFTRYVEGYGEAVTSGLHEFQLTWDDLAWLRGLTDLPLVLKGVSTGEDAARACEHGIDAVWVSNHGGRQLDTVAATADVLAECVDAVAGRAEVYVDGGIRRGTDVVAALALGARAVFAGRPWLYALASGGADGVVEAARVMRAEVENAMVLLGAPTLDAITRSHVR